MPITWPDLKFPPINLWNVWKRIESRRMYKQKEIEKWARDKGIYDDPSFSAQMKGVAEEVVEATEAYGEYVAFGQHNTFGVKDDLQKELGDIYVFWVNACLIAGVDPAGAVDAAYNKISGRTGEMVNGRFVKNAEGGKED